LLGFLSVLAFYALLGFSVVATGLCYYIGFRSKNEMQRVCITSIILILLFSILKIAGVKPVYLTPFATGVMTMGCITYLLGCLILSSKFYLWREPGYVYYQLLMIGSLAIMVLVSSVFNIQPMYNVGCTFAAFYIAEKSVEWDWLRKGSGIWFLILGGSIALYATSLFLHNNPGWVVSMFDSTWIQ